MPEKITVYYAPWCPDCKSVLAFLDDNDIQYEKRNVEEDEQASERAKELNYGKLTIPVVEIDGKGYVRPTTSELKQKLGVKSEEVRKLDCVIIGGGCAGLTAALYLAREMLKVAVVEKGLPGGQITTTDLVENYPGFPEGIGGNDLAEKLATQAKRFGAEVVTPLEVMHLGEAEDGYEIKTTKDVFYAPTVILASGSEYRKLDVPRARELTGFGVSYCATCDGPFFRNKDVAVIGGGSTAVDEANFLARFVRHEYVIHRRDQFRAEAVAVQELEDNEKADILFNTVVTELVGEKKVEALRIRNVESGEESELKVDGVFVFIGRKPNTEFLNGFVDMDDAGFVKVRKHVRTNRPGFFAAGDCIAGSAAQVTTAVGDGTLAAFAVRDYLEEQKR